MSAIKDPVTNAEERIPALEAEIERLRAENNRLRETIFYLKSIARTALDSKT